MAKLSSLKNDTIIKAFIYGQPGTGKTSFGCTLPGPVYVFDFDGKVNSGARFLESTDPKKLDEVEFDNFQPSPQNGGWKVYQKFEARLKDLERMAAEGKFPYQTVVLDSLTTLADALMQYTMATQPGIRRTVANVPAMQDYLIVSSTFKPLIQRFLALPCNVLCVGHIAQEKDENTGAITYRPALSGKLPELLPVVFQEVWRIYTENKDGKLYYLAQCRPSNGYMARTQISGLSDRFVLNYNTIINAMKGAK
jgi:hypothetical protein